MVTFEPKLRSWGDRLRSGDNDYMLISKDSESHTWQLVFNKGVETIKYMYIEANTHEGGKVFAYEYIYDIESIPEFWCAFLIKKGGELLCKDCSGVHGFLNGEATPFTTFRVSWQTENVEFNYEFKDSKARITTYHLHKYCGKNDDPSAKGDWLWE